MAKIEFLDGVSQDSKTILADAMDRGVGATAILVCWFNEEGLLQWSTNATNAEVCYMANRMISTAVGV